MHEQGALRNKSINVPDSLHGSQLTWGLPGNSAPPPRSRLQFLSGEVAWSFLSLREPVSAWSHCAGMMLAVPGILLLWRRSDNDRGGTTDPSRLWPVPGLLLSGQHPLQGVRLPAVCRRFRPPGRRRVLRPDRGGLHPAGVGPDAKSMAAMEPGGRLDRGGDGHDLDCRWPPLSPVLSTCVYLGMGWGVVVCYSPGCAGRDSPCTGANLRCWLVLQCQGGA